MSKTISLISVFVLLNMGIGRMFQASLGIPCFSELSILAVTSFVFWAASAKQIKVWAQKWSFNPHSKSLLIQGGLGLSASALNIIVGQVLVVFLMTTVYQCTSPSFNLLNAGLTNNVAVNLLCYFFLLFHFVGTESKSTETKSEKATQIKVSKKGMQFMLQPKEIVYVETSNNCIVLHTEKGKFVKYQSLRVFQKQVCPTEFKRIHRSYLVNRVFIDHYRKNKNGDGVLFLKNGSALKFSRTYFKKFAESSSATHA
ncbi:LytTR family transcriptional regulator [Muricauda sp. CAU 1633]|uniref:LytTR family DNA-binding domain-containing protein n=1 Tax=Allomuricauda sp. CAU 1633 TaxID=2816036 RepID=UPI001A8CD6EF|nr:LytTR family DNA-binding domain-containing protein [Muricauda sp. CAU 1633]MBO0320844.1 LytTR family transcriptional regulator [Muricauda sp. CAU 1633]